MCHAKEHLEELLYQKDSNEEASNGNLQNLKNSHSYKYRYSNKNKDRIETVLNDNEDIKNKLVELEKSVDTLTAPVVILRL